MVVYVTEDNNKADAFAQAINSLLLSVDWRKHKIILSINGCTEQAQHQIDIYHHIFHKIIYNEGNIGTAAALNKIIALRQPGEHVIKKDDDIYVYDAGWVEQMEEAIARDPQIGIIGLKRKDLIQSPYHPDPNYRSDFVSLPHEPGQRWITVERTNDVIGSCTMFNSALLDKIGYSRQPGKYGFEDSLMCHRSHLAGFYNCFLPHIEIDHEDPGGTDYQTWKEKHSGEMFGEYHKLVHAMIQGIEPIYYNPYD